MAGKKELRVKEERKHNFPKFLIYKIYIIIIIIILYTHTKKKLTNIIIYFIKIKKMCKTLCLEQTFSSKVL